MKSIVTAGKTVEKAIEEALKELGCTQDEVTIRVINEGGLFKKAEVEVTRDNYEDSAKEESVKKEPAKNVAAIEKKEELLVKKIEPNIAIRGESNAKKKDVKKEMATKKDAALEDKNQANNTQCSNIKEELQNFLEGLVAFGDIKNASIDVVDEAQCYKATIGGEYLFSLIGNGGETLQAIETVLNIVSAKNKQQNKRVMLDVGAYKQAKTLRLEEQANAAAKRVRETNEPFKMRPMSNRERRVVHAYLQTQKDIKTSSKGDEPYRCVVVYKATASEKAENASREMSE